MNLFAANNLHATPCGELAGMAKRELTAFYSAVKKSFGIAEASRSGQEWIEELTRATAMPASEREWRTITIRAAQRLARRLEKVPTLAAG